MATARAIDCHHHFGSPGYAKALLSKIDHPVAGYPGVSAEGVKRWQNYSPANVVEALDRNDVATAVLSCTTPGIWFGDPDETRALARDMNEFGARMISDHKGRFGLLALVPLPHIDNSLREIEYALDTLHADGVCVFTSYNVNHLLGDPAFRPVFDELNRRKAAVFVHPTSAFGYSIEFLQDTMRTINSLIQPGAAGRPSPATRYGDIKFMFSHAGGTMPSRIERFSITEPGSYDEAFERPAERDSRLYHLRRFYYDTANSCNSVQLVGLKTVLGGRSQQIIFGSDYPMIPTGDLPGVMGRQLSGLQRCHLNGEELAGIQRHNAERLFPRLEAA